MKLRLLVLRLALAALVAGSALFVAPAVSVLAQGAEPDLVPTCTATCWLGTCACWAETCNCTCTWLGKPSCKFLVEL